MRKVTALIVMLLFLSQPSFAQRSQDEAQHAQDDAQHGQWMGNYYVKKDSSQIGNFLKWMQNSGIFERHDSTMEPMAAFLSIVFADNPDQVSGWIHTTTFTGKPEEVVQTALWLSKNQASIVEISKNIPAYVKDPPPKLVEMKIMNPGGLDTMWAAFSASGDPIYVKKTIDVLDENYPLAGNKLMDMLTRQSAAWSLSSNMRQHELVNQIVQTEAKSRDGAVKASLEKIIAQNTEKHS